MDGKALWEPRVSLAGLPSCYIPIMLLNEILEKPVASHRDGHFDRADATAN